MWPADLLRRLPWMEEIFDVQVVLGVRCPALSGPYAGLDAAAPIWTVPPPA